MTASVEQYVSSAKQGLQNLRPYLSRPDWRNAEPALKTVCSYVDSSQIFHDPRRTAESLWILNEMNTFAYFDADNGGLPELAAWCEKGYNTILSQNPYCMEALRALGQSWLWKAQFWIARIALDGSPASSPDSDAGAAYARRGTTNYIQAQSSLVPAVDFFKRAVQAAEYQGTLSGDLIVKLAEAQMSLGNVAMQGQAQEAFRDALMSLRRAQQMPGYSLPSHLYTYLKDNEYILNL